MPRQHGFDNIRLVLIFLVVFAHLLEPYTDNPLYRMIYTFHMPVFVCISGWFGSFRPRKLMALAAAYLLFQVLYRAMAAFLSGIGFRLVPLTPYWLMWYLPFLILCRLLIPLLRRFPRFPFFSVSILLSLAAGFISSIGYPLTLSRFFVFLPYFIFGYRLRGRSPRFSTGFLFCIAAAGLLLSLCIARSGIPTRAFYGVCAYTSVRDALTRVLLYLPGFVWCLAFLALAQRWQARLPLLTGIGENTLSVYLLHGFAVKLIARYSPLPAYPGRIFPALLLTALLLFILHLPGRLRKISKPTA